MPVICSGMDEQSSGVSKMKYYTLNKDRRRKTWTIFRMESDNSTKWVKVPLVVYCKRKMAQRGYERVKRLECAG